MDARIAARVPQCTSFSYPSTVFGCLATASCCQKTCRPRRARGRAAAEHPSCRIGSAVAMLLPMNVSIHMCPFPPSSDATKQRRPARTFALAIGFCLAFLAPAVPAEDTTATNASSGTAALSEEARKEITALIQQLGAQESAARTRAKAALKARVREAAQVMLLYTNDPDPEIRLSIQELAESMEDELRMAQELLTQGKAEEAKARDMADQESKLKATESARKDYKQAAEVFENAARDFPAHKLAPKATLLAGQCRIRAQEWDLAIRILTALSENKAADATILAESLYWLADCHMKKGDDTTACRVFKKAVLDYPESQWAKYARGRLTDPRFSNIQGD